MDEFTINSDTLEEAMQNMSSSNQTKKTQITTDPKIKVEATTK